MKSKTYVKIVFILLVGFGCKDIRIEDKTINGEIYLSSDSLFSYIVPEGFILKDLGESEIVDELELFGFPFYEVAEKPSVNLIQPSILINFGIVKKADVVDDHFIDFQANLISLWHNNIVSVEKVQRIYSRTHPNNILNAVFHNQNGERYYNSIFYFFYDISDTEYGLWTMTCTFDEKESDLFPVFQDAALSFEFNKSIYEAEKKDFETIGINDSKKSQITAKSDSDGTKMPKKPDCEKIIRFGEVNLCLQSIDGMIECLSDPFVQNFESVRRIPGISTLAFYLPEEIFTQRYNLLETQIDDYFKIYVNDVFKDYIVDVKELEEIKNLYVGDLSSEVLDNIHETVKKYILSEDLIIDRPILIQNYSKQPRVQSLVSLIKYTIGNDEWIGVSIMNLLSIKDRLFTLGYFKYYHDLESIEYAISRNDYIVAKILEIN